MILLKHLPILVPLLAFSLMNAGPLFANACSCIPPDLPRMHHSYTDVMQVKIISRVTQGKGEKKRRVFDGVRLYVASVLRKYKGRSTESDFVILTTPGDSAMCGIDLKTRTYLVTATSAEPGVFDVISCGYNPLWKDVKKNRAKDVDFLNTRTICDDDGGACVCGDGTEPSICKADPCEVSEKCDEGKCTANYCSGCDAEWTSDDGAFVCNECENDVDCNGQGYVDSTFALQVCVENTFTQKKECRTKCQLNGDCSEGDVCDTEMSICVREEKAGAAGDYVYYFTCGDPVCRGYTKEDHEGVPLCNPTQEVGEQCGEKNEGITCDPEKGCNQELLCANSDPNSGPGGCPISRRATKRGIAYLEEGKRDTLAADLLAFRLATWNYKQDPADMAPRLGFIIDDVEPSPATDPVRDIVDVYGYLSMTVAAIQSQQVQIENLRSELERLQNGAESPLGATCPWPSSVAAL